MLDFFCYSVLVDRTCQECTYHCYCSVGGPASYSQPVSTASREFGRFDEGESQQAAMITAPLYSFSQPVDPDNMLLSQIPCTPSSSSQVQISANIREMYKSYVEVFVRSIPARTIRFVGGTAVGVTVCLYLAHKKCMMLLYYVELTLRTVLLSSETRVYDLTERTFSVVITVKVLRPGFISFLDHYAEASEENDQVLCGRGERSGNIGPSEGLCCTGLLPQEEYG